MATAVEEYNLLEHLNVEFVDDVSEFQCVRCHRVLFRHYISSCGHAFCANCMQKVTYLISGNNCPRCDATVWKIDFQNEYFGEKLHQLRVRCPNKNFGCPVVTQLKEIQTHMTHCQSSANCLPIPSLENGNKNLSLGERLTIEEKLDELSLKMEKLLEDKKNETRLEIKANETIDCKFDKIESDAIVDNNNLNSQQVQSLKGNIDALKVSLKRNKIKTKKIINYLNEQKIKRKEKTNGDAKESSLHYTTTSLEARTEDFHTQDNLESSNSKKQSLERLLENALKENENKVKNADELIEVNEIAKNNPEIFSSDLQLSKRKFNGVSGKTYNIALLGENNEEISTFIDLFSKFLQFQSLQSCLQEFPCLINGEFSVENANEKFREYVFPIDNFLFKIIDCCELLRGTSTVQLNFNKNLKNLSKYEKLDAICVLMKTNESTPKINQFLHQLHPNSKNNLIIIRSAKHFCSGKLLQPKSIGSLPTKIIDLLEENHFRLNENISFHFDIEAFRNTVKAQDGASSDRFFNNGEERNESCWIESIKESERLIKSILSKSIDPLNVLQMISTNIVKMAIAKVWGSFCAVAQTGQQNLQMLIERCEEVKSHKVETFKDKKLFQFPCVNLVKRELKKAQNVCASNNCRVIFTTGSRITYVFPRVCADECESKSHVSVKSISEELVEQPLPKNCSNCGCSSHEHRSISYEIATSNVEYREEKLQRFYTLDNIINAAIDLIANLKDAIRKNMEEIKKLTKYAARLNVYEKRHSMALLNRWYERYFEEMVEEEESLNRQGLNNRAKIEGCKEMLDGFRKEKMRLEEEIQDGVANVEEVSVEEVNEMVREILSFECAKPIFREAKYKFVYINKQNIY